MSALAAAAIILFIISAWLAYSQRIVLAGERALVRQPETISLRRLGADAWRDAAAAEGLAAPLRARGYVDLGVYAVDPLPGVRLGVLFNERDHAAAFLTEHPRLHGVSLELNVRYADGNTTALVNHPDRGVPRPPFFRVIHADPGTPSGELHERLLRERPAFGIKALTADNVLAEYQAAWTRIVRWNKQRGLSAGEVLTIAARTKKGIVPSEASTPPAPAETSGVACPHCGRLNEKARDVCWACFKLLRAG